MKLCRLVLGCSLLFVVGAAGCGGATDAPSEPASQGGTSGAPSGGSTSAPSPSTPAVPDPAPPAMPQSPCGDFGGKIHGASVCKTVDRQTAAVATVNVRAVSPTIGTKCNDTSVTLESMTVHLECVETTSGTGTAFTKHAVITLVVDQDTAYPAMKGRRLLLDEHDGFWDFIYAQVGIRRSSVDVTIDYGVLE